MNKAAAAVVGIVVLVAIMILGIFMSWWPLNSVLTNIIPYFLSFSIIALFVWGFRERIDSWFHTIPKPTATQENIEGTKPLVTQPIIKNGIQRYENRSQLPFDEMISNAEQRIEMLAITFGIVTLSYHRLLKGILSRKVHISFLLLDPHSPSISVQRTLYHGGEDLEDQIKKSLTVLCKLKNEFKDLVDIRLYDSISEHSIVIVDRDNADNAWIKVERRPVGSDSDSRMSDVAYRKDNEGFFNQYLREYDSIFARSKHMSALILSRIIT